MVWGGSEYPWDSPMIIGLSVVAVVLLGLFLLQERRATEPILPLRLFRNRTFAITSAAGFIVGLGMFGGIIFLPLFLQVVMGTTPTNSGLLLLPLMGGVVVSSIVSGRLITRTGRYKIYPIVGTSLMAIGLWLFSTMTVETPLLTASTFMLIFGTGVGLVLQVLVIAVQNAVEARDLGVATSSATFFRSLGGSFGTALFGAVLTSQLAIRLASLLPEGAEMGELTGSPDLIAQLPAGTREAVMGAFSGAITTSFAIAVPFALAALLLVIFLPELPLRDTAHVGRRRARHARLPRRHRALTRLPSSGSIVAPVEYRLRWCHVCRSVEQIEPIDVLDELQPPPVVGRARIPFAKTHTAQARRGDVVHAHPEVGLTTMVDPIGVSLHLESPIEVLVFREVMPQLGG